MLVEGIVLSRNQTIQNKFRNDLRKFNTQKCSICGLDIKEILISAHIKPYKYCDTVFEAQNHYNGLILCPLHDSLFESAKFMTIDYKSGKLILRENIYKLKEFLNIKSSYLDPLYMTIERKKYLKFHNEMFYSK